jgi:hypothetical protein
MITKGDALRALRPGAEWNVLAGKIYWIDTDQNQPTEDEVIEKIAELEYLEEVEEYKIRREEAYPKLEYQLDYIYHNGVDSWKTDIIDPVKTAHPKQTVDNDTLTTRKALAVFNDKLDQYTKARARLDQYILSVGKPAITEVESKQVQQVDSEDNPVFDDDLNPVYNTVQETVVIEPAIEALTHDRDVVESIAANSLRTSTMNDDGTITSEETEYQNPLITADVAERATAQAIVDATPQAVIDTYNGE